MSLDHEYSLLGGYNRSDLGRWIARIAAALSAGIVFVLLTLVDLARHFGMSINIPPIVLSLVGAGAIYKALYWLFDRHLWKIGLLGRLLKVPNISGKWICEGESREGSPTSWHGTMTIVQSWDRIRVHLDTTQSFSDSIAAALLHDTAVGYRLLYHYKNQPRIGEDNLAAHHGFAELIFAMDESSATGEYFNGRGRNTFGVMTLAKEIL